MSDPPTPRPTAAAPRFDAVVVGAGISGLTTAYRLRYAGLSVQLLEAAAGPGGVIGSVPRDGCLFERGPNSALDTTLLIGERVAGLGLHGQMRMASKDHEWMLRMAAHRIADP